MELINLNITIDNQTIDPTLLIRFDLEFYYNMEMPVIIQGILKTGEGKIVTQLHEYQTYTDGSFDLEMITKIEKEKRYRENSKNRYYVQMKANLSPKAIEYIELQRERDYEKSARFYLDFTVKYLELGETSQNSKSESLLKLKGKKFNDAFIIKQSDWIKNFSPPLGIGNFLLLEMRIPENKKVSKFWIQLYEKLTLNLRDMEICLQSGDWVKTMFFARKFYENIKIGDKKPAHKKFREEFNKLLAKDQHSQEGIDNLYDGIWKFFDFLSKYSHDKDREGNFNPLPVSTKEDAYFAYALAIGLLNLIGKKTSED
jgi:hypothetical protein